MTNVFRKDVLALLIISAVLTSFSSILVVLHAFYPFSGTAPTRMYFYIGFYLLTYGLFNIYFAIRLGKYNARVLCKILGIYCFISFPVILVASAFAGIMVPKEVFSWNYFMITSIVLINILYQILMIQYISRRLIMDNHGYVVIKNLCWMIVGVLLCVAVFYLVGFIKISFINLNATDPKELLTPGYYIVSAVEIALMIGLSFWILYIGYSSFLSGLVNDLMDLRHNFNFTKNVYQKYHMNFYIGIIGTFVMFVIALIASFTFLTHYLSLVALYAAILIIRISTHVYDIYVDKKYQGKVKTIFRKKHITLILAGIVFIIYTVIISLFGSSSQGKNLDNKTVLTIFIIFVPYALIRAGIAISKYVKYRRSYNPSFLNSFYADVVMAIFTLTNVIIMCSMAFKNQGLIIFAQVLFFVLIAFCSAASIYLIVVGICGLNNKREKSYRKYLELVKREDVDIDEE